MLKTELAAEAARWEEKVEKHEIFKSTFDFSVFPSKKSGGYLWLLTPH